MCPGPKGTMTASDADSGAWEGKRACPRGPGACPHRGPASEQGRGAGQLHRVPVWLGSVLHNYRDQVKM